MTEGVHTIEVIAPGSAQLEAAQRLRAQVYTQMGFISSAELTDGMDIDEDDFRSIHIGAFDLLGELVGTIRVIKPNGQPLPIEKHFGIPVSERAVEISRYSILKEYRGISVGAGLTRAACHIVAMNGKDDMYAVIEQPLFEKLAWMGFPFVKLSEKPKLVYKSFNYPTCCKQSAVVACMREQDEKRPQKLAPFFEAPFAPGTTVSDEMFSGVPVRGV